MISFQITHTRHHFKQVHDMIIELVLKRVNATSSDITKLAIALTQC